MGVFNCLSLFLAGISTGLVIACLVESDWKWVGIFSVSAAFNLLTAFA